MRHLKQVLVGPAAIISERIGYQNPPGGVPAFTNANRRLIFPNEPVLVEMVIGRLPTPEVFKLLTYPLA